MTDEEKFLNDALNDSEETTTDTQKQDDTTSVTEDKFSIQNRTKAETFKDELRENAQQNRHELVSAYKDTVRTPHEEDDKKYAQTVNVANRATVERFKNDLRAEVAEKQQKKAQEQQDAIDRINKPQIMCPNCGLMILADSNQCPECGWENITQEEPAEESTQPIANMTDATENPEETKQATATPKENTEITSYRELAETIAKLQALIVKKDLHIQELQEEIERLKNNQQ